MKSGVEILVVWQSLVVKTYRSFFYKLASSENIKVGLVAPEAFSELGFQNIKCEEFESINSVSHFKLKAKVLHTQAVNFKNLRASISQFFTKDKSEKIILCMAEPYSVTALLVWIKTRFLFRNQPKLILFSLQNIQKKFSLPLSLIQKLMFKKSTAIASLGPEQTAVLKAQGYKGAIFEFPLWFDNESFHLKDRNFVRKDLENIIPSEIRSDTIKIGYVGALVEQKGILDVLEVLKKNSKLWSTRVDCIFVGKGLVEDYLINSLEELNSELNWVHKLGFVPHKKMSSIFNYLDVLVIPSKTMANWKEQFGRVIIEAQACGCTVIGSNSGHIPYLLDDTLTFKEGDTKDLAEKIEYFRKLWSEKSTELRREASQKAKQYSDVNLAKVFAENIENKFS